MPTALQNDAVRHGLLDHAATAPDSIASPYIMVETIEVHDHLSGLITLAKPMHASILKAGADALRCCGGLRCGCLNDAIIFLRHFRRILEQLANITVHFQQSEQLSQPLALSPYIGVFRALQFLQLPAQSFKHDFTA